MALSTRQDEPPGKRVARHESVANVVGDLHADGAIFRPWFSLMENVRDFLSVALKHRPIA